RFVLQQIEQSRHGVPHRLPPWRNVARSAEVDRIVAIACQRARRNEACRDARLKQLPVPLAMRRAHQLSGIHSFDDLADVRLNELECLPVAARSQCVTALPVRIVMVRVPTSAAHTLDQIGGDAIPLDGERVVCVTLVDFLDEPEKAGTVARQAWWRRKYLEDA